MPNHFHFYLCTKEANLSKFMQSLLTSYTVTFNRRHRTSGHLFQGRFKALLVEDEGYGSEVSRYIHLNPVQIQCLSDSEAEEKIKYLRSFKWSSYCALIGLSKCQKWLDSDSVLKRWGKTRLQQQRNYSKYVEGGLLQGITDPFEAAAVRSVLGSESFVERMRRGLVSVAAKTAINRENVQAHKLIGWVNLDDLIGIVSAFYQVDRDRLLQRHSRGNEGRQALIYLGSKHCRGRYTLGEIAEKINIGSVGGLGSCCNVIAKRISRDKGLAKRIKQLEGLLS